MALVAPVSVLRSDQSSKRLEQIANLRARGIGEIVDLPQLVVCGDQSAGKSSVLEGITGIPFPRRDGLCTKFATEIILTHAEQPMTIVAQIIPCSSRTTAQRDSLSRYKRAFDTFESLPDIITEAGALMGLRGFGETEGPAFALDVLRIKVTGPTGLHLSVVDLPGLIAVANEEQTEDDVQVVSSLVDAYAQNTRTIILAVVQATNDIANQGIIQKSRKFDPSGERTVGIITKPDLLNAGTESRIAALAKNQDTTKLKLGFFLLKNPSPSDLAQNLTRAQREKNEQVYFTRSPWKEQLLEMDRVGIVRLREYLQKLLNLHIERELPKVRDEITKIVRKTDDELTKLGEERPTPSHLRMFLSRLAMRFYNLTMAALNGDYHAADASFFSDTDKKREYARLRAFTHNMNHQFSNNLRLYGESLTSIDAWEQLEDFKENAKENDKENDQALTKVQVNKNDPYSVFKNSQKRVKETELKKFIIDIYRQTRGRELPGNYNHVLLTELFHRQSSRWKDFATVHLLRIVENLRRFMVDAVHHLTADSQISQHLLERIETSLSLNQTSAEKELDKLCTDKDGPPITYNHYYTDNVQKSRHDTTRRLIKKALEEASREESSRWIQTTASSSTTLDTDKILAALQRRVLVDMDEQACAEARAGLDAYYKVARKTFVDNVCVQVVERHLLRGLPAVFSPELVAGMSEPELQRIAGEREEALVKRRELRALHSSLMESLHDLRSG